MLKIINSQRNNIISEAASLKYKKYRAKQQCFLIEGLRSVMEAAKYPERLIRFFVTEDQAAKNPEFLSVFSGYEGYVITDRMMKHICDTDTPQGLAAVIRIPASFNEKIEFRGGFYMLMDGINDPGNLGTIIRSACAFDAEGALLINNCADPFAPKAVRASMGGILHLPVFETDTTKLEELLSGEYNMLGASLNGEVTIDEVSFEGPVVIAVGNETKGLSTEVKRLCRTTFHIPMNDLADSINVAVASGIIMRKAWLDQKQGYL
jgi:TrmH family RNA methyltransferase